MSEYTSFIESAVFEIFPDDDNYTEKMIEVMKSFREPNEALDSFLVSKGYQGELSDIQAKTEFIKKHSKAAGIGKPSNRNRWFDNKIGRLPAIELCFAFGLNLRESQEFFRRICLERGLDCHNISEAVYYYCLKNGRSFSEAKEIIKRVSDEPKKERIDLCGNVLYTGSIIEELDRISSDDELIRFFSENVEQFGYNNATAQRTIGRIWKEIAAIDGLANKEWYLSIYDYTDDKNYLDSDSKEKTLKVRSTWDIYRQILGLNDYQTKRIGGERTIKPILRDNPMIHRLAVNEFPNRQNIDHILSGQTKSNEGIRKILILLLFYRYWVKIVLQQKDSNDKSEENDAERCRAHIDQHLADAGYPALYYGNPYDWIFLYAMQDAYPLDTFRGFIAELYLYKEEDLYR